MQFLRACARTRTARTRMPRMRRMCTGNGRGGDTKREPWQKWINYESKYKEESDELNRKRHYFFYVNAKGQLYRARWDRPGALEGEIKDQKFKDRFFEYVRPNTRLTQYLPDYPFISKVLYDRYLIRYACSPVVFTDLVEAGEAGETVKARQNVKSNETVNSTWNLKYGTKLLTEFNPRRLVFCEETGALYHPVTPPRGRVEINGALDASIAEALVANISFQDPSEADGAGGGYTLEWEGDQVSIQHSAVVDVTAGASVDEEEGTAD